MPDFCHSTQNQPSNSVYTFQTALVTIELRDSSNGLIDTGSASYCAAGWRSLGSTSDGEVAAQMLGGNYSFAMVYEGTREQRNSVAIAGATTTVTFETVSVISDSGTATSYYAGGWRSFTSGDELLPGAYTFHFSDGTPNTKYTLDRGTVKHIH